ncbi:MAG: hypothetical protein JWO38_1929 [Gemmataceae bacterium]|nr:hypothetical protein [Gemmataceae bacterium]
MPDVWTAVTISTAAAVGCGLYLLARRKPVPVAFANPREERLTHRLSRVVHCALAEALPAVRRELQIAPGQSDETLLKRAAYHYRQDLPESSCSVYRDRAPG